ncbi:helix-turn-helix domain-containing protein [Microbacterium excoecariae]|uniref:helix-turn-helix domain-containing protein n=1 Tax=Microbacterium excoecariae TaxID=2715210 RepID=UPI00140E1E4A|nr:XRE family transcriptional regulator [Microbacterium excoecariae]NHI16933.1 helix-turn-helix domain-containing protein [Microbacterium excoecariae]
MVHYMGTGTATETLTRTVGGRVRAARQRLSWTLDQLAAAAGVSRRMLVNVEQGVVNPSIGTLLRLSDALGVGLPALVEPPREESVLARVTVHGDGAALWTGEHGGRGVLVAGTQPPDVVELWDWSLGPGDQHDSDAHAPGTRELLQVQRGAVTITVADDLHLLGTGDAIEFAGDVPHSYANPGEVPARISLAVFEPGVRAILPHHQTPEEPSHD